MAKKNPARCQFAAGDQHRRTAFRTKVLWVINEISRITWMRIAIMTHILSGGGWRSANNITCHRAKTMRRKVPMLFLSPKMPVQHFCRGCPVVWHYALGSPLSCQLFFDSLHSARGNVCVPIFIESISLKWQSPRQQSLLEHGNMCPTKDIQQSRMDIFFDSIIQVCTSISAAQSQLSDVCVWVVVFWPVSNSALIHEKSSYMAFWKYHIFVGLL